MSEATATSVDDTLLAKWMRFANSTIGSKMLMAVTGLGLWLFLVAHVAGNLTAFLGRDTFNHYAEALHANPPLLWGVRLALLLGFPLHIFTAIRCAQINKAARPVEYAYGNKTPVNPAATSMIISGAVVLAFLGYHLAHLTWRVTGPMPDPFNPYDMLVKGFQQPLIAVFYIAGQILLAGHLSHGLYSMFQHLGLHGQRWTPGVKKFALAVGYGLCTAFASIPLFVMLGVIK